MGSIRMIHPVWLWMYWPTPRAMARSKAISDSSSRATRFTRFSFLLREIWRFSLGIRDIEMTSETDWDKGNKSQIRLFLG